MPTPIAGFFWSYAHLDNEYDHGRILGLAELIKKEYTLRTRQKLDMFVDSTNLNWGEEWRPRLDVAIGGTTFFIPIITPGYFTSAECRRELLMFAGNASSLGKVELILPILYVDTPVLELEDPVEEAVALVKRIQWEDWRHLRFEAEDSPDHRRAVSRLVNKLLEISANIDPQRVSAGSTSTEFDGSASPSTIDIVAALEQAIPRWGEFLHSIYRETEQIDAANLAAEDTLKHENLDYSSGAASAKVAALRSYAKNIEGPARSMLRTASRFASEVVSLDPGALTLIRAAEQANPAEDFVEYSCDLILVISPRLRQNIGVIRDYVKAMSLLATASQVLHPPVAAASAAMRQLTDGFGRIEEWERRIKSTGRKPPEIPGLNDE